MANDNNDINQDDNNNNDNNDDDSPLQPRRNLLLEAFNSVTTPLRNRSRINRQELIDRQNQELIHQQHQQQDILNLEVDIGLTTTLFDEDEKEEEDEEKEEKENKDKEKENKEKEQSIMPTTTYKIGGVEIAFDNDTPAQNTDYNIGVMISKEDRPDSGSDIERKLIESLCKNQYTKYKKAETSMKSIERLLQSRSIMDTIEATETVLNKFDMKDPFTIVYPEDKTLARVALKMKANGSGIRSLEILSDFRQVTIDEVALSCSWWNLHGHYKDKDNTK
jgi:hypothetical protein